MALCEKYQIPHEEFASWSEEDQDLAIAYHLFQARFCGNCGTDSVKWEENKFAYEAEFYRCRGCEMRELKEQELQDQKSPSYGMKIVLKEAD